MRPIAWHATAKTRAAEIEDLLPLKDSQVLFEDPNISVSVNGVYLRTRALCSALGKYCLNLLVWNYDEVHKVSLLGSATPLLYRQKYLLLCTRHQIKSVKPEEISLMTDSGKYAVTSSGYTASRIDSPFIQHDLQDIVVFEFDAACRAHPLLKRNFFKLDEFPSDCTSDSIVAVLNFGYPSEKQVYELHEKNHIGSYRSDTVLKVYQQPEDHTTLHLKPVRKLDFNPDGLSGGPNFVIQRSGGIFKAYFAGITVRAGPHDLYIVKSGHIRGLLDAAIRIRS